MHSDVFKLKGCALLQSLLLHFGCQRWINQLLCCVRGRLDTWKATVCGSGRGRFRLRSTRSTTVHQLIMSFSCYKNLSSFYFIRHNNIYIYRTIHEMQIITCRRFGTNTVIKASLSLESSCVILIKYIINLFSLVSLFYQLVGSFFTGWFQKEKKNEPVGR